MPAHEVIPAPTFAVVTSTSDVNSRPPEMLESVQLMMDPSTNQHYMVVENPDGTRELRAVQLVTGDMNSIPVGDMNPVPADPSPPIATSSFSQRNAPNPFKASTGPIRNATRAKSNTMPYQKK